MVKSWALTTPFSDAWMVTVFETWLRNVLIANVALLDPAGIMTPRWRRTMAELLLDSPTTTSEGVVPLSVTVAVTTVPPGTGEGNVSEDRTTEPTVRLTVAGALVSAPLLAVKVKLSGPV